MSTLDRLKRLVRYLKPYQTRLPGSAGGFGSAQLALEYSGEALDHLPLARERGEMANAFFTGTKCVE